MLRSKTIFAILLALSFLSNRAQGDMSLKIFERRRVIGYAIVSEDEAERINDNKLYVEESASPTQLGNGFIIVSEISKEMRGEENWYCAVQANKNKLKNIDKAYIPKSYKKRTWPEERNLWGEGEKAIVRYLWSISFVRKPFAALRFSWVKGTTNQQMQMLIPTKVVNNGGLDLSVQCFESEDELKRFSDDVVDWGDSEVWDIKGNLGIPGALSS
ncbi:hypothetical protein MBM_04664 [Drepanopeziza brunnea f. sp. 'multigermtubi' MB_m1]|uniref:Uncharacterized protein n=1 Tax=Marssonina brunnea f. sp. multigermtubi (strain MB_m1) TaxID=1072389 RepID=K1WX23_MARBU|nr:uncharacterized protein MBM_04664 [Drepanopeziza brunnea f. sp. 'multigermtubi' MB_m1]EKD17087.1 hypothetical protein MBM_04664 [Drepanopeziza brunnea f. sp. 'multigermtubi' MB_m1]